MKIVLRSTNISKIQTKSQRHDVTGTLGISLLLYCFLHYFILVKNSVILCTWLFQNIKQLKWYYETNSFNNKKSTELWQKSANIAVSKAGMKNGSSCPSQNKTGKNSIIVLIFLKGGITFEGSLVPEHV